MHDLLIAVYFMVGLIFGITDIKMPNGLYSMVIDFALALL
jgi:hypothetical protein